MESVRTSTEVLNVGVRCCCHDSTAANEHLPRCAIENVRAERWRRWMRFIVFVCVVTKEDNEYIH